MFFDDLLAEAERQLNVCNSCRYCEGYCPVWPALELRTELTRGDFNHLANLCHDCRDCFSACMYTAPHEFDLNPPAIFAQLRERTYSDYIWPHRDPEQKRRFVRVALLVALAYALLITLSLITHHGHGLSHGVESVYQLIGHQLLIALMTVPAVWSAGVVLFALIRYWKDTHGRLRDLANRSAWVRTLDQAARLSHQTGAGQGCSYESENPSMKRRFAHQLTMYGFLLTFLSTVAAAFEEDLLGVQPPYPYLSLPVISGLLGGVMAIVGCTALISLKLRSDKSLTTSTMRRADYGFLWALIALMATGLLALFARSTSVFGLVVLFHLAIVIVSFCIVPYTKYVHWTFRIFAIYKDNLEQAESRERAAASLQLSNYED